MIEGLQYTEVVKLFYSFLESEYGFNILNESINGNVFYKVNYRHLKRIVSISYENIEDYLVVNIFKLNNEQMPDYDDKRRTLHLNKLNAAIISKLDRNEIDLNNEYFAKFQAKNELERKLLKSAKELRLCLKHFKDL